MIDQLIELDRNAVYQLTGEQIEQLAESIVHRTMVNMEYKPSQLHAGRISRQEMLQVISVRQFEKARKTGRLRCHKDGPHNSKVWASRSDWQQFLKLHTNKKI